MLGFITEIARMGGELAKDLRIEMGQNPDAIKSKESAKDLVTEADQKVEEFLISKIKELFPEHGIFAEESGRSDSASDYCWVIDPIDGTASYIHNQPGYSLSIALQHKTVSKYAAIYCPVLQELYSAECGKGAFCNGEKIQVIDHGSLFDSHVATGFSCLRAGWENNNNLSYFCEIAKEAREVRRYGSAALDMCFVAAGKIDAFWELNLNIYDVAAGVLIVEEAGGEISDLHGENNWPEMGILATNKVLHEKMLSYFKNYTRS